MSAKERIVWDALQRVQRGELTVVAAAELLKLSVRQARRVWQRFRREGAGGLVHRLRGRPGNRRLGEALRNRVVKRYQERYGDFGPTLACEKLAEEELGVSPGTLTAWLKERHLWVRQRRQARHRQRRERRHHFGSLVQMDGSRHDWFEGRAPWCVLMVQVDDATSRTHARFYEAETTVAAFDVLGRWVERYGLMRAVYVDRHSIYRDHEDPERPTQFGRALAELGVELIWAHSPQAKGRVERRNRDFQDRLVKELRLRKINDVAAANVFLEEHFLADFNRRFAVSAARAGDLHRAVGGGVKLAEVLCVQEERVVGEDWCVRWRNRWLQIGKEEAGLGLAGKRVVVKELAGGELQVWHGRTRVGYRELAARPEPERERRARVNNRGWKPGAWHPWKRGLRQKSGQGGSGPTAGSGGGPTDE